MRHHPRVLAGFAVVLAAGLPARAQCDYQVQYVPDFDQKRQGALPGDGGMYCVPTSALNWFAYFANHGIPQPAGLSGPRSWWSNSNYNLVTTNLATMGALMGTTAGGGTGGNGSLSGAYLYSLAYAQNKVAVNHYWAGSGQTLSPSLLYFNHVLGGYVAFCYGRYNLDSPGHYTRTGGHCLTLTGQQNACAGTAASTIFFRDPNSDGYNTTQSTFVTHTAVITGETNDYRSDVGQSYTHETRWRVQYNTGNKFIDSVLVLTPRIVLTQPPSTPGIISAIRPFVVEGSGAPTSLAIPIPSGNGALRALVSQPFSLNHLYITAPVGASPSRLFEVDPVTGGSTQRLTDGDFRYLEVNRFGEIYLCDGSVLKWLDPRTNPPTLLGQVSLGGIPRALAYDDATDTVAIVSPPGATASQLVRYPRTLGAPSGAAFPSGVSPVGAWSLAFARNGTVFLCGDVSLSIWRMTQSGNILSTLPSIALPDGYQPSGLNIDDADHVLFSSGGVIREYEPDATNHYVPSPAPAFPGLAASGRLHIPRSRTNHIPSLNEGPGSVNIADTEVFPGVADCYANCDFSTTTPVLNVLDFACFLNQFAAGKFEANCDGSTSAPVLNVLDFACFLNQFAAGCS